MSSLYMTDATGVPNVNLTCNIRLQISQCILLILMAVNVEHGMDYMLNTGWVIKCSMKATCTLTGVNTEIKRTMQC